MASYQPYSAQNNLNFYQSSYSTGPVSGHSTPFQAYGGGGAQSGSYPQGSYSSNANYGFGSFPGPSGPSGQMGTGQSGLRTGWLAAFGTEGYEGEPPLLEELGVNFHHIQTKTLTVLNPMARIEPHIMDDSDLAGPLLFCGLFGTFLLLVSAQYTVGILWDLLANVCTVREALVRLRLRPCSSWSHHTQLHIQHDVAVAFAGRTPGGAEFTQRSLWLVTALVNFDHRSQLFRPRLLPTAIGHFKFTRGGTTVRQLSRVLPGQHSDRVVHVFQLSHVLRRGPITEHAIPGRISSSAILCGLWHHGDIQQQRHWEDRCDESNGTAAVSNICIALWFHGSIA